MQTLKVSTIWYLPGWNRAEKADDLAYPACTSVFGEENCHFEPWQGDTLWPIALRNANTKVDELIARIAALSEAERKQLVLVGHSLGGRIVARTLAGLAKRKLKIHCGILLAPAIPMNDEAVSLMGEGSELPVLLIVNPQDLTLKYVYALASGEKAPSLGTDGALEPLSNVIEYAVSSNVTEEVKIDALWGQSETLKRICNHVATFYFEELRAILKGTPTAQAQIRVPQNMVNVEWLVLDAGIWWELLAEKDGWKLQRNKITRHCRILDPSKHRLAWGAEQEMRHSFNKVLSQL